MKKKVLAVIMAFVLGAAAMFAATVQPVLAQDTESQMETADFSKIAGFWKNADEVKRNWKMEQTFLPSISSEKRESLLKGWQKAVRCVKGWAKDI